MKNKIIAKKQYERVDELLAEALSISRSSIFSKFKNGELVIFFLGKKLTKLGQKVKIGQEIEYEFVQALNKSSGGDFKLEIIFENDDFLSVEKPAGILSVEASENLSREIMHGVPTVSEIILKMRPDLKNIFTEKENFGLVHRLDKETSGILVCAKNLKFYQILKMLFKERKVQKTYQALCTGKYFGASKGVIRSNLSKVGNKVFISKNDKAGVFAETEFEIVKKENSLFFVNVFPHIGRMHQIRVHLAGIGLPVLGDKLYGNSKGSHLLRDNNLQERMMLHAKKIQFLKFEIESGLSLF